MDHPINGCINLKTFLSQKKHSMMSKESCTEQLQMLTFLREFGFTLVLLVVSPLANLSLWKDQLKSLALSQETKINI